MQSLLSVTAGFCNFQARCRCSIALIAQFYPGKHPDNWWLLCGCVIAYAACTLALNLFLLRFEGETFFFTRARRVSICHKRRALHDLIVSLSSLQLLLGLIQLHAGRMQLAAGYASACQSPPHWLAYDKPSVVPDEVVGAGHTSFEICS